MENESVKLEAWVGFKPSSPLQTRKLFIFRSDKNCKIARNAERRYTAGTSGQQIQLLIPLIRLPTLWFRGRTQVHAVRLSSGTSRGASALASS